MNIEKEIQIIVNNNCREVPYEGTDVNKGQLIYDIKELVINVAKLHCTEQAKVISEKAKIIYDPESETSSLAGTWVEKDTILNAYPLDNIK